MVIYELGKTVISKLLFKKMQKGFIGSSGW